MLSYTKLPKTSSLKGRGALQIAHKMKPESRGHQKKETRIVDFPLVQNIFSVGFLYWHSSEPEVNALKINDAQFKVLKVHSTTKQNTLPASINV